MKTIALGRRNPVTLVRTWEEFLRGHDMFMEVADGKFTQATRLATIEFQKSRKLYPDGIIGNKTWGTAMAEGLEMVADTDKSKSGPNWPAQPKGVRPASLAVRQELFGAFRYKPAPHPKNPEAIKILGKWTAQNITRVTVPQLKGVLGAPKSGRVFFHKKAVPQLKALFLAWEYAGLSHLVEGWAGSWVPRFVRGSRSSLSNHAWGTAFDINVPWNGLRRTPAHAGQRGSVRELVPLAAKLGWFWGGWFKRKDGMHFEVSKLLSQEEIDDVLHSIQAPISAAA